MAHDDLAALAALHAVERRHARLALERVHVEARDVLARLELIQHGGTTNLDPTPRARNVESTLPQGESNPPHIVYREQLQRAPTAEAASAVLDEARDELRHATKRPLVEQNEESLAELKQRIVRDAVGWAPKDVSLAMRVTQRLVRVARTEHNRHPDTGHQLPPEGMDEWAWARELSFQGLSLRQINTITGIPKSTLHTKL